MFLICSLLPYLLIDAGKASFTSYKDILSVDTTAKILIVCYKERTPLSKELCFMEDKEAGTTTGSSRGTEKRGAYFSLEDVIKGETID